MTDLWDDDFDDADDDAGTSPEQNFDWDDADVVEDTASAVSPTQKGGTGNEFISDNFDSDWDDAQNVPILEESKPKPKAGKKSIAIGFLLFVILAVVVILTVKGGIEKKKVQEQQKQSEATVTETPDDSYDKYDNENAENTENTETKASSQDLVLKKIPDKTVVDYSGEILESDAKVASKDKYLVDGQVVYCIGLKIAVGSTSQTVSYYCNYSVFQKLSLGDLLTVKYQQIDDKYISITDVLK